MCKCKKRRTTKKVVTFSCDKKCESCLNQECPFESDCREDDDE